MVSKKRKKSNSLSTLGGIGLGVGKLGVGLGVSGAIIGSTASHAPQVAPLSGSISTIAGFAPLVVTIGAGGAVLKQLKGLNKKKKKSKKDFKMFY